MMMTMMAMLTKQEKPFRTVIRLVAGTSFLLLLVLHVASVDHRLFVVTSTTTFGTAARNDGGVLLHPQSAEENGDAYYGHDPGSRNDAEETKSSVDGSTSSWSTLRGGGRGNQLLHHHHHQQQEEEDKQQAEEDEEDRLKSTSRLLQKSSENATASTAVSPFGNLTASSLNTTTTNSSAPPSNASFVNGTAADGEETFSTLILISFPGNKSLVTDEKVNLFSGTFMNIYNNRTATTTTTTIAAANDGNNKTEEICDPLFRRITTVQATANVSLPGRRNWDELGENVPMIPVRTRRNRRRRVVATSPIEQEKESSSSSSSSSTLNDVLWKSLVESHLLDIKGGDFQPEQEKRQLQQDEVQVITPSPQTTTTTGQNWTEFVELLPIPPPEQRFNDIFILLDITGKCRGCLQTGSGRTGGLFDDTSSDQRQRQRQRQLLSPRFQEEVVQQDNKNDDVYTCPEDSVAADPISFQSSLNSRVKELNENGDLDFGNSFDNEEDDSNDNGGHNNNGLIKFVDIPVIERPCASEEKLFVAVYFVMGVIDFDPTLLFAKGGEKIESTIQQVENLVRESYNNLAQQLCDPLFRTIDKAKFLSYRKKEENENDGTKNTIMMEFMVAATCRGDECYNPGCLFETNNGDCQDGAPQQRQRRRTDEMVNTIGERWAPEETSLDALFQDSRQAEEEESRTITESNPGTINRPVTHHSRRLLEGERCVCRQDRPPRPPNQDEFRDQFQVGLDKISESFIRCATDDTTNDQVPNSCPCQNDLDCVSGHCNESGRTCQAPPVPLDDNGDICTRCEDGSDCPSSGICVGSVCAEADGLLNNSCHCLDHESCSSGRCKDLGLVCETVCNEGEDGSCEEQCFGLCTEKIQDTCTEPCVTSRDCASGECGTMVCLPGNKETMLDEGCFSALGSECQSGLSENNICVLNVNSGMAPSSQPTSNLSVRPTFPPTFSPSTPPTGGLIPFPSSLPAGGPTIAPINPPTLGPTMFPTSLPTEGPTRFPTSPPTEGPTMSPTSPPTEGPTRFPTSPPTEGPTRLPTSPPTEGPTRFPTSPPTEGPTRFPTSPPTEGPTISPTAPPTAGPSISPTAPPTAGPSISPTAPPTAGPTTLHPVLQLEIGAMVSFTNNPYSLNGEYFPSADFIRGRRVWDGTGRILFYCGGWYDRWMFTYSSYREGLVSNNGGACGHIIQSLKGNNVTTPEPPYEFWEYNWLQEGTITPPPSW